MIRTALAPLLRPSPVTATATATATTAAVGTAAARRTLASSAAFDPQSQLALLNSPLATVDPTVHTIIELEKRRQRDSIVLIPSENYTSRAVMQALGSVMQNKYSEGYPGARYYGGNEFIDMAESLCQQRALEAFGLDPAQWGCNVQSLSGAPANLYVYYALLKPHERIMGLDLPHGGHLSHGYQTETKKISAVSAYFETMPYRLDEKSGYIDYDALEKSAALYRPKILIAGASAYARNYDYKRMRSIADKVGAYLLSDMAHISGFVAAGDLPSPFEYSDIVTTTTHKSLRGPRGAIIFFRKGVRATDKKTGNPIMYNLEQPINASVFPGHQGGPHNHTITALAVALNQVKSPEFKAYSRQCLANNQAFARALQSLGYSLVSDGTDNHLLLVDLKPAGIDGARVERVLELANIAANKNTVPGDKSAMVPGGLRMGTPAMTSRGFGEKEFERVAGLIDRAVKVAKDIKDLTPGGKLKEFKAALEGGDEAVAARWPRVKELRDEVRDMARAVGTVGFDVDEMTYKD